MFKFRVWDNENKSWNTEDLTLNQNGLLVCDGGITIFDRRKFEISFFTGIKDKNDKEIYEGDIIQARIIKYGMENETNIYKVKYDEYEDDDNYCNNIGFIGVRKFLKGWSSKIPLPELINGEVIGNVYENTGFTEPLEELNGFL